LRRPNRRAVGCDWFRASDSFVLACLNSYPGYGCMNESSRRIVFSCFFSLSSPSWKTAEKREGPIETPLETEALLGENHAGILSARSRGRMRDKFLFEPNARVQASHQAIQGLVQGYFTQDKTARKAAVGAAQGTMAASLPGGNANATHAALHNFERAYLQVGDWQALRQLILNNHPVNSLPGQVTFGEMTGNITRGSVEIYAKVAGQTRNVGTVYFGESRFAELDPQPGGALVTVYKRRGDVSNRHYIFLPNSNTYVKRFVTRGLNGFDGMNLSQNLPMVAALVGAAAQPGEVGGDKHPVLAGTALTIEQQALSHTRGWAGAKRFISTGVSNRAAYSTRGTEFISMFGLVTIDLAMLPGIAIYDVHRPDTAEATLGIPAVRVRDTVGHHTNAGDLDEQQYLGMRDVIRTRELLIHGQVPAAAVQSQSLGECLLGIGSQTGGGHNAAPGLAAGLPAAFRIRMEQDHLNFRDRHTGRLWHFLSFPGPVQCNGAFHRLVVAANQAKVKFNKYDQVRPAGMV
jgi:hypothetical protein